MSGRGTRRAAAAIGVLIAAGGAAYLIATLARSGPEPAQASTSTPSEVEQASNNDEDPPTLAAAIARARPAMVDQQGTASAGTLMLTGWANRHLRLEAVEVSPNETSYAQVRQDPGAARGKRMCVAGKLTDLSPVRTDAYMYSRGVLSASSAAEQRFAFSAVGSAGALAPGSDARLCGVVTGWIADDDEARGPAHAVILVGVFDLPENRS
jgi:hypothetical protein